MAQAINEKQEEFVRLGYTDWTSDKIYEVNLQKAGDDLWNVVCYYGRRPNAHNYSPKAQAVHYGKAKRIFEQTIMAKQKKGYEIEKRR